MVNMLIGFGIVAAVVAFAYLIGRAYGKGRVDAVRKAFGPKKGKEDEDG